VPSDQDCNTYDQDCPDGQKCNAWANDGGSGWNALACFPIDPAQAQVGDVCTVEGSGASGYDSCDLGLICWDVDPETDLGTCIAYCQGSPANPVCADPNTTCIITNDAVLNLCLPICDPLLQDCDGSGSGCYPIGESFVCVPDAGGEQGAYGEPCEFLNVCDPGSYCATPEWVPNCEGSFGCCSPYCDLTNPMASMNCPGFADGQECIPWYEEGQAPPGYEDVGACGIPL